MGRGVDRALGAFGFSLRARTGDSRFLAALGMTARKVRAREADSQRNDRRKAKATVKAIWVLWLRAAPFALDDGVLVRAVVYSREPGTH